MEHYQAREFVRYAQSLNHYMAELVNLLKSQVANPAFSEYGIARLSGPTGSDAELCVSVHLRKLITTREHVWHRQEARKSLYGCVGIVELVGDEPTGAPLLQVIVRHDGFVSFDGTIDMALPIQAEQGYGDQIATTFAQDLLLAVQARLRSIQ
ncbi:hypothetical protein QCE64_35595 [Caballeronia sp. LZ043]|nr:hypothetical protein [Caballeronia sp. LZ043]